MVEVVILVEMVIMLNVVIMVKMVINIKIVILLERVIMVKMAIMVKMVIMVVCARNTYGHHCSVPLHEMALALFFSVIPIEWSLQRTLNTKIIKIKIFQDGRSQPDPM